jgi:uncharacterized membrane protein
MTVQLEADTDARWTITYRYALQDENEIEAFRTLASEYESGQADIGVDVGVFRSVAAQASASTGRPMQIRNVERSATVERNVTTATANETAPANETATATVTSTTTTGSSVANATGVLRLSFTWTNFLEQNDDGSLVLGDVFVTRDGGTWLTSLGTDQRLTVVTPPGFVISRTSFPIQQQNESLVIDGPREFTSEERLSVTYRPSDQAEIPWMLLVGGFVAVVVVLALVFYFGLLRGRSRSETPAETTLTNGGESTTETGGTTDTDGDAVSTGPSEPTPTSTPGDDETTAASDATDDAAPDEPDFELLSDEERVEYLLEERGGRMKQANIVKETGWSDAKVSQLLSSMAQNGRVEKLRLGRENLISLPDEPIVDDTDARDE